MFDLEKWKRDWQDNTAEVARNLADDCFSERIAQRCRNVERLLLLDLVQHLARLGLPPGTLTQHWEQELELLVEAARMVGS